MYHRNILIVYLRSDCCSLSPLLTSPLSVSLTQFEAYAQLKQNKAKNNPSRAEIREHMAKYDEIMKQKGLF